MARNCGGRPLKWLSLPINTFLDEWECVGLSIDAENEAQKTAMDEAKSSAKKPDKDFDEWMKEANLENAVSTKEKVYGIKRKR